MSQMDFMEKDTVLVLDNDDNVIGSESKRGSHEFNMKQPAGVLHRAFSVFIFDESTNELLLQQRATDKITFPSVSRCLLILHECVMYANASCSCVYDLITMLYSHSVLSIGMDQHMLLSPASWNGTS